MTDTKPFAARLAAKALTAVALAATSMAPAAAQTVSGNVALTTNYVFRGVTQSDDGPAIQGGFDLETEAGFYAGTWASSVDFGDDTSLEIDFYGGYGFAAGGFDLDVGAIYYAYPGAPQVGGGDQDFVEIHGGISRAFGPVEWSGSLAWSPDFYGETGQAWYAQAGLGFEIADGLTIDGAVGFSRFDDFPGADYEDYQIGLSGTVLETIGWDIRYFDVSGGDESIAFTVSQSFGG